MFYIANMIHVIKGIRDLTLEIKEQVRTVPGEKSIGGRTRNLLKIRCWGLKR